MKIVLSRKGFDSANGGYPSPILPDGRLISIPIPIHPSNACADDFKYSDILIDEHMTYLDLMKDIYLSIYYGDKTDDKKAHLVKQDTRCHLDPDIYPRVIERDQSWKPLFGQIDAAQTHLENTEVGVGDVFLFFGWFRNIQQYNSVFSFTSADTDKHIIFGYLQIGEKIRVETDTPLPNWMNYHPHTFQPSRRKNNTIYVARDSLTWENNLPGAGVFSYNTNLVLTKDGLSRSRWCLPECFRNVRISYHTQKSWKSDYFQSVARGQEFVVDGNEQVKRWAKELIQANPKRHWTS